MQIIKDQQIIDDNWQSLADDDELATGDISVSLNRWQQEKPKLLAHDGRLGIRINPADTVTDFADDLDKIALVELDFPDFADGRLFTHAWLLRSRYGYQGEIRATGNYMPDQVFYLSRVGVNAFKPAKTGHLPVELGYLNDFTVNYQASAVN
ncbi:MAG: DUF934 domain-containing protein [Methylovulum sp.]|uniref:DUF934 domain-containing protein n=1 Tax=Methylovulum sp. TaxID=1916980 RepID=UPI002632E323|nr:DUF934 domain-containing protein [Methylovulum sp.]MDD2722664.1 DUF934 domain-containing protein [Methylovulum sp.]MDD5125153.1 DUF934 domain-containing protein [Methylovulum sp.]